MVIYYSIYKYSKEDEKNEAMSLTDTKEPEKENVATVADIIDETLNSNTVNETVENNDYVQTRKHYCY